MEFNRHIEKPGNKILEILGDKYEYTDGRDHYDFFFVTKYNEENTDGRKIFFCRKQRYIIQSCLQGPCRNAPAMQRILSGIRPMDKGWFVCERMNGITDNEFAREIYEFYFDQLTGIEPFLERSGIVPKKIRKNDKRFDVDKKMFEGQKFLNRVDNIMEKEMNLPYPSFRKGYSNMRNRLKRSILETIVEGGDGQCYLSVNDMKIVVSKKIVGYPENPIVYDYGHFRTVEHKGLNYGYLPISFNSALKYSTFFPIKFLGVSLGGIVKASTGSFKDLSKVSVQTEEEEYNTAIMIVRAIWCEALIRIMKNNLILKRIPIRRANSDYYILFDSDFDQVVEPYREPNVLYQTGDLLITIVLQREFPDFYNLISFILTSTPQLWKTFKDYISGKNLSIGFKSFKRFSKEVFNGNPMLVNQKIQSLIIDLGNMTGDRMSSPDKLAERLLEIVDKRLHAQIKTSENPLGVIATMLEVSDSQDEVLLATYVNKILNEWNIDTISKIRSSLKLLDEDVSDLGTIYKTYVNYAKVAPTVRDIAYMLGRAKGAAGEYLHSLENGYDEVCEDEKPTVRKFLQDNGFKTQEQLDAMINISDLLDRKPDYIESKTDDKGELRIIIHEVGFVTNTEHKKEKSIRTWNLLPLMKTVLKLNLELSTREYDKEILLKLLKDKRISVVLRRAIIQALRLTDHINSIRRLLPRSMKDLIGFQNKRNPEGLYQSEFHLNKNDTKFCTEKAKAANCPINGKLIPEIFHTALDYLAEHKEPINEPRREDYYDFMKGLSDENRLKSMLKEHDHNDEKEFFEAGKKAFNETNYQFVTFEKSKIGVYPKIKFNSSVVYTCKCSETEKETFTEINQLLYLPVPAGQNKKENAERKEAIEMTLSKLFNPLSSLKNWIKAEKLVPEADIKRFDAEEKKKFFTHYTLRGGEIRYVPIFNETTEKSVKKTLDMDEKQLKERAAEILGKTKKDQMEPEDHKKALDRAYEMISAWRKEVSRIRQKYNFDEERSEPIQFCNCATLFVTAKEYETIRKGLMSDKDPSQIAVERVDKIKKRTDEMKEGKPRVPFAVNFDPNLKEIFSVGVNSNEMRAYILQNILSFPVHFDQTIIAEEELSQKAVSTFVNFVVQSASLTKMAVFSYFANRVLGIKAHKKQSKTFRFSLPGGVVCYFYESNANDTVNVCLMDGSEILSSFMTNRMKLQGYQKGFSYLIMDLYLIFERNGLIGDFLGSLSLEEEAKVCLKVVKTVNRLISCFKENRRNDANEIIVEIGQRFSKDLRKDGLPGSSTVKREMALWVLCWKSLLWAPAAAENNKAHNSGTQMIRYCYMGGLAEVCAPKELAKKMFGLIRNGYCQIDFLMTFLACWNSFYLKSDSENQTEEEIFKTSQFTNPSAGFIPLVDASEYISVMYNCQYHDKFASTHEKVTMASYADILEINAKHKYYVNEHLEKLLHCSLGKKDIFYEEICDNCKISACWLECLFCLMLVQFKNKSKKNENMRKWCFMQWKLCLDTRIKSTFTSPYAARLSGVIFGEFLNEGTLMRIRQSTNTNRTVADLMATTSSSLGFPEMKNIKETLRQHRELVVSNAKRIIAGSWDSKLKSKFISGINEDTLDVHLAFILNETFKDTVKSELRKAKEAISDNKKSSKRFENEEKRKIAVENIRQNCISVFSRSKDEVYEILRDVKLDFSGVKMEKGLETHYADFLKMCKMVSEDKEDSEKNIFEKCYERVIDWGKLPRIIANMEIYETDLTDVGDEEELEKFISDLVRELDENDKKNTKIEVNFTTEKTEIREEIAKAIGRRNRDVVAEEIDEMIMKFEMKGTVFSEKPGTIGFERMRIASLKEINMTANKLWTEFADLGTKLTFSHETGVLRKLHLLNDKIYSFVYENSELIGENIRLLIDEIRSSDLRIGSSNGWIIRSLMNTNDVAFIYQKLIGRRFTGLDFISMVLVLIGPSFVNTVTMKENITLTQNQIANNPEQAAMDLLSKDVFFNGRKVMKEFWNLISAASSQCKKSYNEISKRSKIGSTLLGSAPSTIVIYALAESVMEYETADLIKLSTQILRSESYRPMFKLAGKLQIGGNREITIPHWQVKIVCAFAERISDCVLENIEMDCLVNFGDKVRIREEASKSKGLVFSADQQKWANVHSSASFLMTSTGFMDKINPSYGTFLTCHFIQYMAKQMAIPEPILRVCFNLIADAGMKIEDGELRDKDDSILSAAELKKRYPGLRDGQCFLMAEVLPKGYVAMATFDGMNQGIFQSFSSLVGAANLQLFKWFMTELKDREPDYFGPINWSASQSSDDFLLYFERTDETRLTTENAMKMWKILEAIKKTHGMLISPKSVGGRIMTELYSEFYFRERPVLAPVKQIAALFTSFSQPDFLDVTQQQFNLIQEAARMGASLSMCLMAYQVSRMQTGLSVGWNTIIWQSRRKDLKDPLNDITYAFPAGLWGPFAMRFQILVAGLTDYEADRFMYHCRKALAKLKTGKEQLNLAESIVLSARIDDDLDSVLLGRKAQVNAVVPYRSYMSSIGREGFGETVNQIRGIIERIYSITSKTMHPLKPVAMMGARGASTEMNLHRMWTAFGSKSILNSLAGNNVNDRKTMMAKLVKGPGINDMEYVEGKRYVKSGRVKMSMTDAFTWEPRRITSIEMRREMIKKANRLLSISIQFVAADGELKGLLKRISLSADATKFRKMRDIHTSYMKTSPINTAIELENHIPVIVAAIIDEGVFNDLEVKAKFESLSNDIENFRDMFKDEYEEVMRQKELYEENPMKNGREVVRNLEAMLMRMRETRKKGLKIVINSEGTPPNIWIPSLATFVSCSVFTGMTMDIDLNQDYNPMSMAKKKELDFRENMTILNQLKLDPKSLRNALAKVAFEDGVAMTDLIRKAASKESCSKVMLNYEKISQILKGLPGDLDSLIPKELRVQERQWKNGERTFFVIEQAISPGSKKAMVSVHFYLDNSGFVSAGSPIRVERNNHAASSKLSSLLGTILRQMPSGKFKPRSVKEMCMRCKGSVRESFETGIRYRMVPNSEDQVQLAGTIEENTFLFYPIQTNDTVLEIGSFTWVEVVDVRTSPGGVQFGRSAQDDVVDELENQIHIKGLNEPDGKIGQLSKRIINAMTSFTSDVMVPNLSAVKTQRLDEILDTLKIQKDYHFDDKPEPVEEIVYDSIAEAALMQGGKDAVVEAEEDQVKVSRVIKQRFSKSTDLTNMKEFVRFLRKPEFNKFISTHLIGSYSVVKVNKLNKLKSDFQTINQNEDDIFSAWKETRKLKRDVFPNEIQRFSGQNCKIFVKIDNKSKKAWISMTTTSSKLLSGINCQIEKYKTVWDSRKSPNLLGPKWEEDEAIFLGLPMRVTSSKIMSENEKFNYTENWRIGTEGRHIERALLFLMLSRNELSYNRINFRAIYSASCLLTAGDISTKEIRFLNWEHEVSHSNLSHSLLEILDRDSEDEDDMEDIDEDELRSIASLNPSKAIRYVKSFRPNDWVQVLQKNGISMKGELIDEEIVTNNERQMLIHDGNYDKNDPERIKMEMVRKFKDKLEEEYIKDCVEDDVDNGLGLSEIESKLLELSTMQNMMLTQVSDNSDISDSESDDDSVIVSSKGSLAASSKESTHSPSEVEKSNSDDEVNLSEQTSSSESNFDPMEVRKMSKRPNRIVKRK